MIIAVLVKYVPDATGARTFTAADSTVDRSGAGLLSELDEYAVEQAILDDALHGSDGAGHLPRDRRDHHQAG